MAGVAPLRVVVDALGLIPGLAPVARRGRREAPSREERWRLASRRLCVSEAGGSAPASGRCPVGQAPAQARAAGCDEVRGAPPRGRVTASLSMSGVATLGGVECQPQLGMVCASPIGVRAVLALLCALLVVCPHACLPCSRYAIEHEVSGIGCYRFYAVLHEARCVVHAVVAPKVRPRHWECSDCGFDGGLPPWPTA